MRRSIPCFKVTNPKGPFTYPLRFGIEVQNERVKAKMNEAVKKKKIYKTTVYSLNYLVKKLCIDVINKGK